MRSTTSNFTLAQLADFQEVEHRLRAVGLRGLLDDFDTGEVGCSVGEVIACYRPRDPNLYLWTLFPTQCGRVSAGRDEVAGAASFEAGTVSVAIDLIVADEEQRTGSLAA